MAKIELTGDQTRELRAIDQAVQALRDSLLRAERAGLDVQAIRQQLEDANAKRQGMLREFSPEATARRQR